MRSRGVYIVKDEDLADFLKQVDSDFTIVLGMRRWSYSKVGTSRDGLVTEWRVILQ